MNNQNQHKYAQLISLCCALLISAWLLPSILKLSYDDSPGKIFQFDSQVYRDYQQLIESFPHVEEDFVIILPGPVFELQHFNKTLDFVNRIKAIRSTGQLFSIADLPIIQNVITDPFTGDQFETISAEQIEQIESQLSVLPNGIHYLLASDLQAQLIIVRANTRDITISEDYLNFRNELVAAAKQSLPEAAIHIGGAPAMKVAINEQLSTDTQRINILAALFATLVGAALFRSMRLLLVITLGPALGTLWLLGLIGLRGDQISVFTSILVPLVFVLGYTNAAHIIFAALRRPHARPWTNSWSALNEVARACLISALTTSIGFASLALSSSPLIFDFGVYSALGSLLVFISVVLVTPAMCSLLRVQDNADNNRILNLAKDILAKISHTLIRNKTSIASASLALILISLVLAFQNQPDYQFKENFSPSSAFYQAMQVGDRQFDGATNASVLVSWPESHAIKISELIELERKIGIAAKTIFDTERTLGTGGLLSTTGYQNAFSQIDSQQILTNNFVSNTLNVEKRVSFINIPIRDEGAKQLIPKFDQFTNKIAELAEQNTTFSMSLTGIAPLAMYASESNIKEMAASLLSALLVIYLVISLLLRSARLGLICMLPNIIPIAGVAALLTVFGIPLHYTSVLVFIICLGIAVDDTVHFVLRYQSELKQTKNISTAISHTVNKIGLVLIFTSSILGAGFASLMFSSISALSMMGALAVAALILALFADLIFLPALLASRFNNDALRRSSD